MKSAFVLIVFLLTPFHAWGTETLTLAAALEKVSGYNLELEVARSEIAVLEGRAVQSKALSNPELQLAIQEIPFNSPGTAGASKEISVDQLLEPGKKRFYRHNIALSEVEAAKAQYRVLETDILTAAKRAYWELSFALQNVGFAGEEVEFQQRFLARVQDRYNSGQAKTADLAQARLESAKASQGLEAARKEVNIAAAELNEFMGLDIKAAPPALAPVPQEPFMPDEDKLILAALKNRADFGVLAAAGKGADAELALARRTLLYPDLKIGLVYQNGAIEPGVDSWGARLGFSLPVFYRYRGESAAASARIRSLAAQRRFTERKVSAEVHRAYLEAGSLGAQLELSRKAVDYAVEAARLSEQQYLDGKEDILLFIQARRDFAAAKRGYIETLNAYQSGLAELEKAVGANLER